MGHDADFRSHIEGTLNLMGKGGKGWLSVPTRTPRTDMDIMMGELLFRGLLGRVAVNVTPYETEEGEPEVWEILVSTMELGTRSRPAGSSQMLVDVEVQVEDLALKPTRSSGGQGPEKPTPPARGEGVKDTIGDSDTDVDRDSRPERD